MPMMRAAKIFGLEGKFGEGFCASVWGIWNSRKWLNSGKGATRKPCTSESQTP